MHDVEDCPEPADEFVRNRPLLFTVAYEMLGTATDADDVLQEAFLRWADVDHAAVDNPRAYLVRIVTRVALNHLRTVQRRREDYIGNWVPEPLQTARDIAADAVLAESVSMAMLLVLETLTPAERAVFVLHEIFGFSHAEIARIVDKSVAAVRQVAHRARSHVAARRQRFEPDSDHAREIVAAFLRAAGTGDIDTLMGLLAPDVVQMSDGGGNVAAARKPVIGRQAVARFSIGIAPAQSMGSTITSTTCNGLPAVVFTERDRIDTVVVFEIATSLIHRVYAIRNPDKLTAVQTPRHLDRQEPRHGRHHGNADDPRTP